MKKIVAAAAAGLLLAGAAFADVSFSWTGTRIFEGGARAWKPNTDTDCLALELSTDTAGVVFDWDITSKDSMGLDSYYGWMTFGLPVGNLQVTSGKWASRYVDRVKVDAGDLDAVNNYYEWNKPGVINGKVAFDSDNLTKNLSGDTAMSTIAAYTLADTLPGTLLVKGGIVSGDYYASDNGIGKRNNVIKSGFAGEVGYRQEDLFNVNVAVKKLAADTMSVGVFLSPLAIENLRATAGFSFGTADESTTYGDGNEFGIDLRARYAFSEKTAVTGMFNYSKTELTKGNDGEDLASMWLMASVSYVAGDNIRFTATMNHQINDFSLAPEKGGTSTQFVPGVEIQLSENATFTAAAVESWTGPLYSGKATTEIPVSVTFGL